MRLVARATASLMDFARLRLAARGAAVFGGSACRTPDAAGCPCDRGLMDFARLRLAARVAAAWRPLRLRGPRHRLGGQVLALRQRAHDALGARDRGALDAQLLGLCGDLPLEPLARLGEL